MDIFSVIIGYVRESE